MSRNFGLPRDVSSAEVEKIVSEVLDVTGLADNAIRQSPPFPVGSVSCVHSRTIDHETVGDLPDEPTLGLDPVAELNMMRLFREIASSGRTIIMTTHAMANLQMFDRIAVVVDGNWHSLEIQSSPEILRSPGFQSAFGNVQRDGKAIVSAEELKQRYPRWAAYSRYISAAAVGISWCKAKPRTKKTRLGLLRSPPSGLLCSRRFWQFCCRDKLNIWSYCRHCTGYRPADIYGRRSPEAQSTLSILSLLS